MAKDNFIDDLIEWLEMNLEQEHLYLKDIADKSGYSLWHLQRLFRNATGQTLGTYIRCRRLTKTALALRFSPCSIVDIALQYRFDSQQTFTRAFKKQFCLPPAEYRHAKKWHTQGIQAPFYRKSDKALPSYPQQPYVATLLS